MGCFLILEMYLSSEDSSVFSTASSGRSHHWQSSALLLLHCTQNQKWEFQCRTGFPTERQMTVPGCCPGVQKGQEKYNVPMSVPCEQALQLSMAVALRLLPTKEMDTQIIQLIPVQEATGSSSN